MKKHIRKHKHHYKALSDLCILVVAAWIAEGTMAFADHELRPFVVRYAA